MDTSRPVTHMMETDRPLTHMETDRPLTHMMERHSHDGDKLCLT